MSLFRGSLALLAAWLALVALLATTGEADAHPRLVESDPSSGTALGRFPSSIRLIFSEAIDHHFSHADLLSASGGTVAEVSLSADPDDPRGAVVLLSAAGAPPPGVYTLVWRALSAVDGHTTTGTVVFSVGTGQAPPFGGFSADGAPWWRIGLRWLEFGLLVTLTGGFALAALILLPAGVLAPSTWARWRGLWLPAAGLLVAAMVVTLIDRGRQATGPVEGAVPAVSIYRRLVVETTSGQAWLLRLLLLGIAATIVIVNRRRVFSPFAARTALSALMVALASFAWSGHAAAEERRLFAIANDALHLVAVALWLGALPFLLVAPLSTAVDPREHMSVAVRALARYTWLAGSAAAILVITGFVNASFHVGGPRSLRADDYGRFLVVKVGLVLLLVVVAALNPLVNRPRLVRSERAGDAAAVDRVLGAMRRTAVAELVLAAAILIAAAGLTESAPADGPRPLTVAAKIVTIDQRAEVGTLKLWLLARLSGEPGDRYLITISGADDHPLAIQRLIVETAATMTGGDRLGDRFDAEPLSGSSDGYVVPATRLGVRGLWDVRLIVRRAGVEDVSASFRVDTTEAGLPPVRAVAETWRWPRPTPLSWGLVAAALIIAGGAPFAIRWLRDLESLPALLVLTMATLIAAGLAVSAWRHATPKTDGHELVNPIEREAVALQRGEATYLARCLACHGPRGAGNDAADPAHAHGAGADLTDRPSRRQSDGDLYWSISQGVPGSAMPLFAVALDDRARWELVLYLRHLQENQDAAEQQAP